MIKGRRDDVGNRVAVNCRDPRIPSSTRPVVRPRVDTTACRRDDTGLVTARSMIGGPPAVRLHHGQSEIGPARGQLDVGHSRLSTRRVLERMPIIGLALAKVGGDASNRCDSDPQRWPMPRVNFGRSPSYLARLWAAPQHPPHLPCRSLARRTRTAAPSTTKNEVVHYLLRWPWSTQRSNSQRPIPRPRPPPRRMSCAPI